MNKRVPLRFYLLRGNQTGAMLVLTMFVVTAISVMLASYWVLIRLNTRSFFLKQRSVQAYYAALGGVHEAIEEIREGHSWNIASVDAQWQLDSGTTFFKSTTSGTPLTNFDYPTTIYVTVSGDPTIQTVNITSVSQIVMPQEPDRVYSRTIRASVIRSLSGDVIILNMREL